MRSAVELPAELLSYAERGPAWASWLDGLPRLVGDVLDEWELTVDGPPWHGFCALVLPVVQADGVPAVAKFSWMHEEQEHEHLGLQAWHGDGIVRLYRADPARGVMLLERLDGNTTLETVEDVEACTITAAFYPRLHIPALPQLRTLSSYITRWTSDLERLDHAAPIPRRLVEQAVSLGRDFVADDATDARMIHGDLHYENVLAADREPWLAIDPKPMAGDPHYEPAPMLWNRWDEVVASGHVRDAVRRRFFTLVDAAGLDEQRARAWVVVREMHNALWTIEDAVDARRPLDAEDRAYLTTAVTIAKAVQD